MSFTRLVLLPNWLGDAVMAEPALRALHEAQPETRMVGAGRSVAVMALANHPAFSELIEIRDRGLLGPWKAGGRLRDVEAEEVLLLRNSTRSALVARRCGAARRIGYRRDGRSTLLTHAIEPPSRSTPIPAVDDYADLVEAAFDIEVNDRRPALSISDAERVRAAELLADLPRPVVGLVPGASKLPKRWPAEKFAGVAAMLHQEFGGSAVLLGSPEEADVMTAARQASTSPLHDLASRGLTLDALRGVIAGLDLLIANDTGPRHLANATGTPAICLFGPTDHRWTMVPGVGESMVLAEPFLDDEHIADHHPGMCRIDRIPVGDVAWHAARVLSHAAQPKS
ncbi:MAG: glycosyltransferase family 9 protein [Phycisphaerales bacterium]|nr:glycosyltransferase family 9 protein [Phycisphaerales bacterium]